LVAAAIAASVIAGPVIASMPAQAATELTFWSWRPEDKAFYEEQAALFKEKTGISVKFTPYVATEYNALLATALTAGSGPDVMQVRAYGGMSNLSDAGNFLALTTKDVPALAKMSAGTLAAVQGYTSKKQYGLPYATSVIGVMYNPDLLKEAGIKALPSTWDSFLRVLAQVKAKGIIPLGNGTGYAPGLEQLHAGTGPTFYGGTQFFNDVVKGTRSFTDKNYVASLQAVKDLVPFMPATPAGVDYNTARGLFANEKAAFYIGGNYEISYFRSLNPSLNVAWMPAPSAAPGAKRYVTSWADGGFAINAKTKAKPEAIKFLNFLASKDFNQAAADQLGWIPTAPYIKITDPAISKMSKSLASQGTPFLNVVGFRFGTPTSSAILQPGFQKLTAGTTTAADLAKDVQAAVATWYAPQKGKS
jgi:raffinose/stachyose/melibiose transport system substrate-binding protein